MAETQRTGGHYVGPRAYLEDHPTAQSIKLGGRYINAKKLAVDQNLCHSYVTRILNGQRPASISYYQIIATALCMGLEELIDSINDRREELTERAQRRLGLSA